MLEASGLILHPWLTFPGRPDWEHAVAPGTWTRQISDAENQTPLGVAAFGRTGQGPFASWFGGRSITVFETDDASHVMTMRRGFWRVWEVHDAEKRGVGAVHRGALVAPSGDLLASLRPPRRAAPGDCLDVHGTTLARFERLDRLRDGAWTVTFCSAAGMTPFLRMLLLAAALSFSPEPG